MFGMFFLGAVLCFSFSWPFHTVYRHSEKVSYSGIALLIAGSSVPWLYHSYCSPQPWLFYLSTICVLGISAIIVAQWHRLATPKHRQTRAGVFPGLGLDLSSDMPTLHFTTSEGFVKGTTVGQMGCFFLMAVMFITRAGLFAARIPERFFSGKFDTWFQSHQIFSCPSGGSSLCPLLRGLQPSGTPPRPGRRLYCCLSSLSLPPKAGGELP